VNPERSHTRQLIGSLAVAVLIVVVTVLVVTAKFGSTSVAEREALEERQEERQDALEERRENP
jgi:type II secretory pathway pseudopilin PulG